MPKSIQKIAATSPPSSELKIYLPAIFNNYAGLPSSSLSDAQSFALLAAASGTYSILVDDGFNRTFTGEYNLFLQRLNSPANPLPIAYGETLTNTISLAAEMDTYTFAANAGDKILIGATQLSDVWPRV